MKIMYYKPYSHTVSEVRRLFKEFKDVAEKEGETAIALPDDIVVLQNVPVETLLDIRNLLNKEIAKRQITRKEDWQKLGYSDEEADDLVSLSSVYI